jgi:uncharacterized protein (DUF362 family)
MSNKPDRREFLRTGLIASAAMLSAGPATLLSALEARAAELPDLAIAYGRDPAKMARTAVDAVGGMKRFVKAGNKVVIKPNMSFASGPKSAANTDPAIVEEVARMAFEAGASRISVLDNVLHTPNECLSLSKIPEFCSRVANTTVHNVQAKRMFKEAPVPHGKQLKSMEIMAEVLDADVLIAVPVGKSHSSSGVSLSMKGMMGLIYDRRSFHSRYDLHDAIVDMCFVLKPALVVVDGTRILSSGGPGGPGKVIPLNLVIASPDMVAADAQMVALGTWYDRKLEPHQVRHIRNATERKLGRSDLQNMNIKKIEL